MDKKIEQLDLFKSAEHPLKTERENRLFYFDRLQFEQGNNKRNKARANAQRRKKREKQNGKNDI